LAARFGDLSDSLVGGLAVCGIVYRDKGAGTGQALGHGLSKSSAATCHQRGLASKNSHNAVRP
jgi:hypothetical protein